MGGALDAFVAYWGDPLKDKTAQEIADFYRRLAGFIEGMVGKDNSWAAKFLLHWLDGAGKPLFVPATAVSDLPEVRTYLITEVRAVFLTQKKTSTDKWGGIGPRLKRTPPFDRNVVQDAGGNYPMMYEGPPVGTISQVQFGQIMKKYSETSKITDLEKRSLDIFTSFHKFGIKTDVVVAARQLSTTGPFASQYRVEFQSWTSTAFDTYNWNYDLGFPVPNPDFGSKDKTAIAPDQQVIVIRHSHARTVKDKSLAQDFDITTSPWKPSDPAVVGPGTVDLARIPT